MLLSESSVLSKIKKFENQVNIEKAVVPTRFC